MALRSGITRNILSLCSGVGGLELGIHLALQYRGEIGRGICHVEIEASASSSLVASMEAGWLDQAPIWSDMRTFDAKPWRGIVDILASGDPCQDNSVAGKGAGKDGQRFLAPEVCRIAAECRPSAIFRENVPGNADGQLAALVPPLEGLGYRVACGIFSSSETGNTMRRERLFIMAVRKDGEWGMGARSERVGGTNSFGHERTGRAWGRGHGPQDPGCDMERAEVERCGEGRPEHVLQQRGYAPAAIAGGTVGSAQRGSDGRLTDDAGRGAIGRTAPDGAGDGSFRTLGRPSSAEPQGQQRVQHHPGGRQVKGGHPLVSGRAVLPPTIIPGPTDSRWIDVLDRFPELQPALSEEEAQSHLRRGIDAMAHRVERLRATGNGVDPMVAAYAFLSLGALLAETR